MFFIVIIMTKYRDSNEKLKIICSGARIFETRPLVRYFQRLKNGNLNARDLHFSVTLRSVPDDRDIPYCCRSCCCCRGYCCCFRSRRSLAQRTRSDGVWSVSWDPRTEYRSCPVCSASGTDTCGCPTC